MLSIDKVEPARAIRVWSAVGQRAPVATTAMGRALLAARRVPDDLLDVYLQSLPPERITRDRLRDEVDAARRRGYATELEENQPGVACLGMALLRGDQPIAAFSITSLAERLTTRRQAELAELIRRELPATLPDGIRLQPAP